MNYQALQGNIVKDKARILDFWAKNQDKSLDGKFSWMYENNPYGLPCIWLIEIADTGELVGMGAIFPRPIMINGKEYLAGILGDMLVHKAHRTLGPALLLQKSMLGSLRNGTYDLVFGFPNKNAEVVLRRVGYVCLGRISRSVRVIRSESYLRRNPLLAPISKPLSHVVDLMLRLGRGRATHYSSHYRIAEDYTVFDERFNELWRRKERCLRIVPARSSEYMTWKFRDDPDDTNHVFAIFIKDSSLLLGCMIYRAVGKSIEIREFIAADEMAAQAMMIMFFDRIKDRGMESVFINHIENETFTRQVRKLGFHPGSSGRNIYLHVSDGLKAEGDVLLDHEQWLLVGSDEDT